MTTLRQIVIDSLREGNVIAVGATPAAEEFDEALRRLQNIIKQMYGSTMGEPLSTVSLGSQGLTRSHAIAEDRSSTIDSTFVPANTRLICNLSGAKTVYLPPNPRDGARVGVVDNSDNFATNNLVIDGNGRDIESASTVTLATNSLRREWFYRADLGNWTRVTDLTADDESPFPEEFDDLLLVLLARRLNPRYGIQTAIETRETMTNLLRMFRARYRQSANPGVHPALIKLSGQLNWNVGDSDFDTGTV